MPTSSSTIRMSFAAATSTFIGSPRRRKGEDERHACPARLPGPELDATAMLVDDLLHDGEAQPRAFWLRGDVRLERALHDVGGEAGPVVAEREYRLGFLAVPARLQRDLEARVVA